MMEKDMQGKTARIYPIIKTNLFEKILIKLLGNRFIMHNVEITVRVEKKEIHFDVGIACNENKTPLLHNSHFKYIDPLKLHTSVFNIWLNRGVV